MPIAGTINRSRILTFISCFKSELEWGAITSGSTCENKIPGRIKRRSRQLILFIWRILNGYFKLYAIMDF
jgi:hypothetical protein